MSTLILGGTVYDGLGSPAKNSDVLIDGQRIVSVGASISAPADCIVDASGKVVCPGFIDIHRHADAAMFLDPEFGKTEKRRELRLWWWVIAVWLSSLAIPGLKKSTGAT